MPSSADPDRKSTRLNSSHLVISYDVFCLDRKSTRLNSSHLVISYAVFCLKKKNRRIAVAWEGHGGELHLAPHREPCNELGSLTLREVEKCISAPAVFFFFNDTGTPEIYTFSLPDALPI